MRLLLDTHIWIWAVMEPEIPKGEGTIDGMGESFSAQLSTGIATYSVPIAVPKACGAVSVNLGLS